MEEKCIEEFSIGIDKKPHDITELENLVTIHKKKKKNKKRNWLLYQQKLSALPTESLIFEEALYNIKRLSSIK